MTDSDPKADAIDSTVDDELGVILDQYLQQQERGEAVSRDEFLAQHPEFAERLAACLDGVALFAAGELAGEGNSRAKSPESIGDFEIVRELGRGGMGVVYEAREKSLDRIVALKVMRFGVVDPRALERFQREAETAGALHHTNIVPVYATGREGDTSWYAMQRIDGESLAHRIQRAYQESEGPIPVEEILRVGIQAAEALDHAHQRDVVHRDVKPANLIVDQEDRVWLTDFGLARRLVDVGATMTGAILGTPRYMSPEQADLRRVEVDHRTDIYSLGATLYEMATGRPPFEGDDPLKVIGNIRFDEPPSPRSLRHDLPRDLDVVLNKCMEKEAGRRYATAAELADDLRAIRDDRAIRARAVSIIERLARWTRKHQTRVRVAGITVLATAVTILLSVVGWQSWKESTLGTFRLRAAGGPFMTSIHPVGESSLSKSAVGLTVPMQRHAKLPIGDYDMTLAPRGRWSQKLRLPVTGGMPTEYRLRSTSSNSREVSIEGACATSVAGFDESAVIVARDGKLQRITLSGERDWTLDVSKITATRAALPGGDADSAERSLEIDFANTSLLSKTPLGRAMLDHAPQLATPQLALRTAIDLDGDGRADTLVAAVDKSALLAIDASGHVLWARGFDINDASLDSNPTRNARYGAPFTLPGIIDLLDVGDRDGDGIHDIAASMVHIEPGIQNHVCVTTLSGKTGAPIQVINPPPLNVADKSLWPQDGVLKVNGTDQRRWGGLSFTSGQVRRSSTFVRYRIDWSGGRRLEPTFALPSPLQVVPAGERLVAIYHAGAECIRYDLDSGEEIGRTIVLPFTPATGANLARLDSDSWALIFHERESRSQATPAGVQDALRVVAYSLDGTFLWDRFLEYVDWHEFAWLQNKVDWPLAGDADGDGGDELVLPTTRYRNGEDIGIEMIDPADGSSIWNTRRRFQLIRTADEGLHRIALASDIDGDGWREWATAIIAGPPSPDVIGTASVGTGEAYVYVDWISGRTGEPIAWARHPIPIVAEAIQVAEVDAIRCNFAGGQRGTVEVDLVTGAFGNDSELESMVLRFHPSSPDVTQIAAGLQVVQGARGTESQPLQRSNRGQVEDLPRGNNESRVYHMRPGPYVEGPERLVLLAQDGERMLRLGEQKIVAVWKGLDERQRIAVQGFEPARLSVVDADTQETIWSTTRDTATAPQFTPITVGDRTDFLVKWGRVTGGDEPPTLLDGETGESKWTMSDGPGGRLIDARLVAKRWMLVVGDGHGMPPRGSRPPDAFKMSLVSAASGRVRWSTYFLDDAPRYNYPREFPDLQVADVTNDGMPDVIGPDHEKSKQELFLAAWDGATGERLWARPLFRSGPRTDYFVPFSVVPMIDRAVVAYIGPESEDALQEASLIVCHAATGEQLVAKKLPDSGNLLMLDRDNLYMKLAIAACSSDPDQPRIGLLNYHKAEATPRWTLFDVTADSLQEAMAWQAEPIEYSSGQGVWLRDVTGDGVPERFVATFLHLPATRSEDGAGSSGDQQTVIARYELEATEPTWEMPIKTSFAPRIIWKDDPVPTAYLQVAPNGFTCVDLVTGEKIATFDHPSYKRDELPRVVAVDRQARPAAIHLAAPSADGLVTHWLGDIHDEQDAIVSHREYDPRREERLISFVGVPGSFAQILRDAARALAAVMVLAFMPLAYVGAMIRRRQWSLSWMMLAPPGVLLMLLVWNSDWTHEPHIAINLVSGVAWLMSMSAVYLAIRERDRSDFLWGRSWIFIVVVAAFVFAMLLAIGYAQDHDPSVRYLFTLRDAGIILFASVCQAGHLYWIVRIFREAVRWLGKRRGKAHA